MHEPFDMTTIIFALLAIFVVWKLSSVLGIRTGSEKPPREIFPRRPPEEARRDPAEKESNVIRLPGAANDDRRAAKPAAEPDRLAGFAEPGTPLRVELEKLRQNDPNFDPGAFLEGAKSAYEMIINAFTQGEEAVLRNLLADDVYSNFAKVIADRASRGETASTTLVAMNKAVLDHVEILGPTARIGVLFSVKLISCVRDKTGDVIEGHADKVVDVNDLWTFAREIRSRDPNWRLVATATQH
jgi:predicted lipid-binding transport protein (Tim44 family)